MKDCRTCKWFDRRGEKRVSPNGVYRCTAPLPDLSAIPVPACFPRFWLLQESDRRMMSYDAGRNCPAHEKAPKP